MNLTPVESSHIAAIGYLEAERVLLVRYKDGSLYARTEVPKQIFEGLMSAPSKGGFLHAMPKLGAVLITKGVMPTEAGTPAIRGTVAEPGGNAAPSPGPLNVINEDADKCCRRSLTASLAKYPAALILSCGNCGQEFKPEMVGPNRFWRIIPSVAIVRQRR